MRHYGVPILEGAVSFFLWFGLGGGSCSNFLASTANPGRTSDIHRPLYPSTFQRSRQPNEGLLLFLLN